MTKKVISLAITCVVIFMSMMFSVQMNLKGGSSDSPFFPVNTIKYGYLRFGEKNSEGNPHLAEDYIQKLGDPVKSVGKGKVIAVDSASNGWGSSNPSGKGPYIIIRYFRQDNSAIDILYGHTASSWIDNSNKDIDGNLLNNYSFSCEYIINWKVGDIIEKEQIIGFSAPWYINKTSAPHLHFSVFLPYNNQYQFPNEKMGYGPIIRTTGSFISPVEFFQYYKLNNENSDQNQIPENQYKTEYFDNKYLSGSPTKVKTEERISHYWSYYGPGDGIGSDNFSIRWSGKFQFYMGTYKFHYRSDDGIRVWIDNELLIDNWNLQGADDKYVTKRIFSGMHTIICEYFENEGLAEVSLDWTNEGVVDPPELESPHNGEIISSLPIQFKWKCANPNKQYRIQVSKDEQFNYLIINQVNVSLNWNGAENYTKYYWRVQDISNGTFIYKLFETNSFEDNFSETRFFNTNFSQTGEIPTIIEPYNNATNVSLNTIFRWKKNSDPDYLVFVTDSYGNSIYSSGVIQSDNVQIYNKTLTENSKYNWTLYYGKNNSYWNQIGPMSFTTTNLTQNTRPDPPTLSSPYNEERNVSTYATFIWNPGARASGYFLRLVDCSDNNRLVWDSGYITGNSVHPPNGIMQEKKKYSWSMQSYNSAGYSSQSSTYYFYTNNYGVVDKPDIPDRSYPQDGATNVSLTPTFSWYSSPRATSYRIWLIYNNQVIFDQNNIFSTSFSIPSGYINDNGTLYQWKIQANNSSGSSAESNGWTFRTFEKKVEPPDPPSLSSPYNEERDVSTSVTFIWNPGARASGYYLRLVDISDNNTLIWDSGYITGNSIQVPYSKLQTRHKYSWKMQSYNSAGFSSETSSFIFYTQGYGEDELKDSDIPNRISPSDGQENVSLTPTFSWYAIATADHYRVWIIKNDSVIYTNDSIYGTSFTISNGIISQEGEIYTWKIQSIGKTGKRSAESNGWSFRTFRSGPPPDKPNAPVLEKPSNGDRVGDQPEFRWRTTDNKASGFFIYIYKASGGGRYRDTGFLDKNQYPNSYVYRNANLDKATKYEWSMQAKNDASYSDEPTRGYFYTEGYQLTLFDLLTDFKLNTKNTILIKPVKKVRINWFSRLIGFLSNI